MTSGSPQRPLTTNHLRPVTVERLEEAYRSIRPGGSKSAAALGRIAADEVLTSATIPTAPRKARCVEVPQIPSGRPRTTARAIAQAPTVAVRAQPVRSPQQGPAMRSPIRMTWRPRIASVAAISELTIGRRSNDSRGAGPPASTPRRLLPTRSSSPCSSRSPLHPPIQTPVRVLSRRDQSLSSSWPNH